MQAKEICENFGKLCGLYCKWSVTKAIFISPNSSPQELQALDWSWEIEEIFLKLPGVYFGEGRCTPMMMNHLEQELEKQLKQAKLKNDVTACQENK
jgi:hypothetical protein